MNKTILITGAAGFLGSKFSIYLSNKNYEIICVDKNYQNLKKINEKNLIKICADITKENDVRKIYRKFKKKNIYAIINNAAIDAVPKKSSLKNLKYPELSSWDKEIKVSILGSFLMIKYFGEEMCKKKRGSIVNIGSDLSFIAPNQKIYQSAYPNYIKPPTYSVVKHGLLGLTKFYASLFANKNVRVNMISPGPIKNLQNPKLIKEIKKVTPMNRLASYDDLFGLLEFLINDQSKFITGQNIFVDGGRTII